jgi:hypothetical protein
MCSLPPSPSLIRPSLFPYSITPPPTHTPSPATKQLDDEGGEKTPLRREGGRSSFYPSCLWEEGVRWGGGVENIDRRIRWGGTVRQVVGPNRMGWGVAADDRRKCKDEGIFHEMILEIFYSRGSRRCVHTYITVGAVILTFFSKANSFMLFWRGNGNTNFFYSYCQRLYYGLYILCQKVPSVRAKICFLFKIVQYWVQSYRILC